MSEENDLQFSKELGALAKALAAAQGEIKDARKDAKNPHFKNTYASLASIREAITPAFAKNGLSYVQLNEPHGSDGVMIVTLLMHESGQWIRSRLYVPVSKKDAQGFGSALTYGRRYALAQISGIAFEDEDDGNEASKPGATPPAKPSPAPPAAKQDVDANALKQAILEAADVDRLAKAILAVSRVKEHLSKETVADLSAARERRLRELEASQAAQ